MGYSFHIYMIIKYQYTLNIDHLTSGKTEAQRAIYHPVARRRELDSHSETGSPFKPLVYNMSSIMVVTVIGLP